MKHLRYFLLFTALAFPFLTQAQNDSKASAILKDVSDKYKAMKSMSVHFQFSIEDQKKKSSEKHKGSLFKKGDKFKLEIESQEILCDGKTQWTYIKESNEVQIKEPSNDEDGLSPTNIFTMYEKGFSYKYIEESKLNGKAVQIIDLVPNDKKKRFFKVRLTIDKAAKAILSSKIFEKNGVQATYSIDSMQSNPALADDIFTFNVARHPGVEVIDLR